MQLIPDLYRAARYNDAISLYLSSDLRPQVEPHLINIVAACYFKLGQYRECHKCLESIEVSYADDINFLSLYAASCRKIGQLAVSKKSFLKALSIAPDNITVLNNYSNLLIDLHEYDQAYSILHELVQNHPDYSEAASNFARVQQIRGLASISTANAPKIIPSQTPTELSINQTSLSDTISSSLYFDPLLFAFSEEEVKRTAPFRPSVQSGSQSGALAELIKSLPLPEQHAVASDQLDLAFRAVSEGNPSFALQACSHALPSLENNSELYSCVGDAYLAQKNFIFAELYFLHSIALGSNSFKNNFNLASLACMKHDFGLAEYYLGIAHSIDHSNALVSQMKHQITRLRDKPGVSGSFSFNIPNPYIDHAS